MHGKIGDYIHIGGKFTERSHYNNSRSQLQALFLCAPPHAGCTTECNSVLCLLRFERACAKKIFKINDIPANIGILLSQECFTIQSKI